MKSSVQRVLDTAFPPGTFPTNSGGVYQDQEVGFVLVKLAEYIYDMPCAREPDCEVCNALVKVWWDWCNGLHNITRIRLQRVMRECNIPLPRAPWEEVPTSAIPAAFN